MFLLIVLALPALLAMNLSSGATVKGCTQSGRCGDYNDVLFCKPV
jgi:hypothetical protein